MCHSDRTTVLSRDKRERMLCHPTEWSYLLFPAHSCATSHQNSSVLASTGLGWDLWHGVPKILGHNDSVTSTPAIRHLCSADLGAKLRRGKREQMGEAGKASKKIKKLRILLLSVTSQVPWPLSPPGSDVISGTCHPLAFWPGE